MSSISEKANQNSNTNPNEITFIWDLDGTLLDSYGIIVNSLYEVYKEKGAEIDKQEILKEVIGESVSSFILKMEKRFGIPFDNLKDRYSFISGNEKLNIKAMKNSKETLEYLCKKNIRNFVFTHRGVTTEPVLKNIGIYDYFIEIVTSLNKFKRKPDPEGINYIIDKYNLDKNNTYYVGDRRIDIDCANNAGIKSIMFIPNESVANKTGKETIIINDLLDLSKLF